jgi:hypothetical protein
VATREKVAETLRVGGWLAFWVQLVLLATSAVILLFAIADPGFNVNFKSLFRLAPTLGALIALGLSVYWHWQYVQFSHRLRSPDPAVYPSRAQVTQTLEKGVNLNLIALLLTLIAAQSVISALLIKVLSMPAGIAVAQSGQLIEPLDIFVVQACIFLIIAEFVGIAIAFRLLKQLHHP